MRRRHGGRGGYYAGCTDHMKRASVPRTEPERTIYRARVNHGARHTGTWDSCPDVQCVAARKTEQRHPGIRSDEAFIAIMSHYRQRHDGDWSDC